MKKTILVMLMVLMITTPCLAEVETEGIFCIGGTKWVGTYTFPPSYRGETGEIGFYRGTVYGFGGIDKAAPLSFYMDLGIASFFMVGVGGYGGCGIYFGIMQPIGIGVMTFTAIVSVPPFIRFAIASLIKIDDNWIPPEVE